METSNNPQDHAEAIICQKYGNLKIIQKAKPIPKAHEVLVEVKAASINAGDLLRLHGKPFLFRLATGLFKPIKPAMGGDFAGVITEIDNEVNTFQIGDEVFGDISDVGLGAFATYCTVPASLLAHKPKNMNFQEAAALPMAAGTALQAILDKGNIQKGQQVLIYGASGGVGGFALQLAKAFGAEVTAVCSTRNVEMAYALGADFVIDYKREDFSGFDKQYDLILACNGFNSLATYKKALKPQGTYVMIGGTMSQIFQAALLGSFYSQKGGKTLSAYAAKAKQSALVQLKELAESGKIKAVIDKVYPFNQGIEAIQFIDAHSTQGKVIIDMQV